MKHWIHSIAAGAAVLAGGLSASAQDLITNGSFDLGPFVAILPTHQAMHLPVGSAILPGWEIIVDEVAWINTPNNFAAGQSLLTPYGQKFLDLGGQFDVFPFGGVRQTIPTVPGTTYNLTFAVGSYEGIAGLSSPMRTDVEIDGVLRQFTLDAPTGTTGNYWEEFQLSFVATGATTPISFVGSGPHQFNHSLDRVSVVAAPEPVSLGLYLTGIALLGLGRQKKQP